MDLFIDLLTDSLFTNKTPSNTGGREKGALAEFYQESINIRPFSEMKKPHPTSCPLNCHFCTLLSFFVSLIYDFFFLLYVQKAIFFLLKINNEEHGV